VICNVCAEVIGKLDIGTATGWLQRLLDDFIGV
jgi:hypothetical protein